MATAKKRIAPTWEARVPQRIWIGSYDFAVKFVPHTDPMLDGNDAMTSFHGNIIYIGTGMTPSRLLNRLLHELTHGINMVVGLTTDTEIEEEEIADLHGDAWASIWINNPVLTQFVSDITTHIRKEAGKV